MLSAVRSVFFGGVVLFLASLPLFSAGTLQVGRNSDPTYQQLRNLTLGEAVTVNNLDLRRDAATFHLRSGTVCFASPVQDKVTGAVFVGDGNFVIAAPSASERSMLKLLTKEDEFSENFSQMVLRFTDATYDELKKAGSAAAGGCDSGPLKDSQNATRHNRQIKYNLEARILEDVLSLQPGALFVAFVHGKRYSDKELFTIDPHSALEDVALETYEESKSGLWAGFPLSERSKNAVHRNRFYIEHQQLDATIEKSGNLIGKASTTLVSQNDGLRIVPLELFRTLRVDSVTGDAECPYRSYRKTKTTTLIFLSSYPRPWRRAKNTP